MAIPVAFVLGVAAYSELRYSMWQARYLADLGKVLTFRVGPGPSDAIRFPRSGPYDWRLGYALIPDFVAKLRTTGFEVQAQARMSAPMQSLVDRGIFVPYREKSQAGLTVLDRNDRPMYRARFPQRVYENFDAIPRIVVDSLLFIENRDLLDPRNPNRNPSLDWGRLGRAVLDKGIQMVDGEHRVPGGSTLATQIEKYRHTPDGVTLTAGDKLRQMASASVRAYLGGPLTMRSRERTIVDYLNTVPLSAAPGFGEVSGLGDGLWAWYGLDWEAVNRILRRGDGSDASAGLALKSVLSLLIAQRRPTHYLGADRRALASMTDGYLRLLAEGGVIEPELRDAALQANLAEAPEHRENGVPHPEKAAGAVRARLAAMLALPTLYDLDRLDMAARSTLDAEVQHAVTAELKRLRNADAARAAGLYGRHLLGEGDPGRVIYSFSLYELVGRSAKVRVQADNLDQPFDINVGTKLDLGSTAKLRTLVTYLEVIAHLHDRYAGLAPEQLREIGSRHRDALTRWAIEYLEKRGDRNLPAMLEAAMQRRYSASPHETFFTGGGVHRFANFQHEDDGRTPTVREALAHSINLAFIRLMRDIVGYYMFQVPGSSARLLEDASDPARTVFLERYAERDSRVFVQRFYRKYRGLGPEEAMERLLEGLRPAPRRLAAVFRYIEPAADLETFCEFLAARLPQEQTLDAAAARKLYEAHAPGRYPLGDRGFMAQRHPLELLVVAYLRRHPEANYEELIRASTGERVGAYDWLIKTKRKNVQDVRLLSLLEVEAFLEIHREWRRLGYPFDALVPSYATAIGSSADRPAALAELMGVILNGGLRSQPSLIDELQFGVDTPFETRMRRKSAVSERAMRVEVAEAVRAALVDVVASGTAKRIHRGFAGADGAPITVGGKTGTGDHRYKTFLPGGRLVDSRVVNRAATFVFFIGDRFYGTVTAFVPGPEAAKYRFTSSLPVQLLKHLAPALTPLLGAPCAGCADSGLRTGQDAEDLRMAVGGATGSS